MSGTSSLLVVQTDKEEFKCVYVGYDGYPAGIGKALIAHYNSLVRANELVSGGSMAAVKPTMDVYDPSIPYHLRGIEYYVRDCGATEESSGVKIGKTIREAMNAVQVDYVDYVYVWKEGRWSFSNTNLDFLADLAGALTAAEDLKEE